MSLSINDFALVVHRALLDAESKNPSNSDSVPVPSIQVIDSLFKALLFMSIKSEEGRSIQLRIFYIDPTNPDPSPPRRVRSNRWKVFHLDQRVPLTVKTLCKFAKAAPPWTSGVAIYSSESEGLFIWGVIDQIFQLGMAIVQEHSALYPPPGLFHVVVSEPADMTVFHELSFVARLAQDRIHVAQNNCLWKGPVSKLVNGWVISTFGSAFERVDGEETNENLRAMLPQAKEVWTRTVARILINIQRQRHGGALLITDQKINHELSAKYSIDYTRISESILESLKLQKELSEIRDEAQILRKDKLPVPELNYLRERVIEGSLEDEMEATTGAIKFVASLAGVDGLILASPNLSIRGFGVEITTQQSVLNVLLSESHDAKAGKIVPADSYGTRHRSMFRFCFANPQSLGFVVSQDGDIRAVLKVGKSLAVFDNVKVQLAWIEDLLKDLKVS